MGTKISALPPDSEPTSDDLTVTVDSTTGQTKKVTLSNLGKIMYPIGSIYTSVVSTNPTTFFGGTWSSFGAGRVMVGIDPAQSEFDTVLETGGDKNLASHKHWISGALWDDGNFSGHGGNTQDWGLYADAGSYNADDQNRTYGRYSATSGTGTAGNLQPYIVVYMWRRTA